jgi:crotonobetainyl-CoA:carnitine CoA-transferase CaiB-like acyl-CoA transferase
VDAPPPALGQHNQQVFSSLGLSEAEQAELKAKGVI